MLIVWTTINSEEGAHELAKLAATEHMAACAQVDQPILSFYEWKDNSENDKEWRIWFKLPESRYGEFESWLCQHHPYEVPQVIAVSADKVYAPFNAWAEEQTSDKKKNP